MSTSLKYWEAVRAAKEAERAKSDAYWKRGSARDGEPPSRPSVTAPASAVRLVDVDIPFERMVWFMVKWALASIPAASILFVLFFVVSAIVGVLVAMWRA